MPVGSPNSDSDLNQGELISVYGRMVKYKFDFNLRLTVEKLLAAKRSLHKGFCRFKKQYDLEAM